MGTWPVQDAKARFSELLERCLSEGPQTIIKRGVEAAVLVPAQEWHRMKHSARPRLKELLLGDGPRFDLELSSRRRFRRRPPVALD